MPPSGQTNGAPRPPGSLSLDELNRIVLEFLHKKGYSRTEAMLRLESSRQATQPSSGQSYTTPVPSTGPESYVKAYALLLDWVDSSLDMYQPELNRFMFPLFVLMFLELVSFGEPERAQDFFKQFSEINAVLHPQDLQAIRGIRLPQHIEENSVAQQFMTQRYSVRISPTTFDLLLFFLHSIEGVGGSTIIRLINQHFNLKIVPKASADEEVEDVEQDSPLKLGRMPLDPEFRSEVLSMLEHYDKDQGELQSGETRTAVFEEATKPEADSPSLDTLPLPKFKPADVKAAVDRVVAISERAELGYHHANQAALPSVAMYTFHNTNDDMNCVSFSPDSTLCAGGFSDSFVMLWSLRGKKLVSSVPSENQEDQGTVRRLVGHSGAVFGISFSPDNRAMLTASEDCSVRLWSMDTYTALVAYRGHTEPVWDVAFSPFGHYFVTGSHDQTARLWSVDHIYPLRIFAGHMSDVDCVCFHPNGLYVVTGSTDKTVRMWDVVKGDCVRVFIGHVAGITAIAVSPNGRWIASAGDDAVINVWDIGTGRRIKKMRGHGLEMITSLSFSAGGEVLVSGSMDCTVRVWDMTKNTGEQGPQPEAIDGLGDDTEEAKRREIPSTTDHMAVFNTKRTPVYSVGFTEKNLVLAASALTL